MTSLLMTSGGAFLCGAVKYVQLVTMYASAYVLLSTAVDRYVAICKPFLSHKWTSRHAHLLVLTAWLASLVFSLPQVTTLCVSVCLSVSLSVSVSLCLYLSVSVSLSLPPPPPLSLCLSVCFWMAFVKLQSAAGHNFLSVCLCLSVCLFLTGFSETSFCRRSQLFLCLSIRLSVCF